MIPTADHAEGIWLARARDRDTVLVGGETVTLLYWRNRRARIKYPNGRERTVDTCDVSPQPGDRVLITLDSRRRVCLSKVGRPEHTRYSVLVQPDGTLVLTPIEESVR